MTQITKFHVFLFLVLVGCGGGNSGGDSSGTSDEPLFYCTSSGTNINTANKIQTKNKTASAHIASIQNPPPEDLWQPDREGLPAEVNLFYLEYSPIEGGSSEPQTQLFTSADAYIPFDGWRRRVEVQAANAISVSLIFSVSEFMEFIEEGYYPITEPEENINFWQFDWYGPTCDSSSGWFVVDSVTYAGDQVDSAEIRFELQCQGKLNGWIRWRADDTTVPPGPQNPIPAGLWQPDEELGLDELGKNHVYLEARPSIIFGQGYTHLYTLENSVMELPTYSISRTLDLRIDAEKDWRALFSTMVGHPRFEVGYYETDGENPIHGSFSIGCGSVTGWYAVDHVAYSIDGELTEIDLRFEQYCGDVDEPLHGKIRWRHDDPTLPPLPQFPPPDGLWKAGPDITLRDENYLYIEGDAGDFVTLGNSYLFANSDSLFELSAPSYANISVYGDYSAHVSLAGSISLPRLQPGYYGPFVYGPGENGNPAKGGLYFGFGGRSCFQPASGWFAVDDIDFGDDGQLSRLKARIEQKCGVNSSARVQLQWDRDDTTLPPWPLSIPANLWAPDEPVPRCSSNYIYLESDPGEFLGEGYRMAFGGVEAEFLDRDPFGWEVIISSQYGPGTAIYIAGQYYKDRLERGYYEFFSTNPARGRLSASVSSRGCGEYGWLAVDDIAYDSEGNLTEINARFELFCSDPNRSLKGKVVWSD